MDLGTPIKRLLESSPLNKLSNDDRMIVAGQLGATIQIITQPLNDAGVAAMNLLERAVATEMDAPDETWFQDYFALTGEHMILTDEGWTEGSSKSAYKPDEILCEVNAPEQPSPNDF